MQQRSSLKFTKMHGAGNDFVILDIRDRAAPTEETCRYLSDRHFGVGCDMILGVALPRSSEAIASYKIWTSDGLPVSQCGNGARCIAAWVLNRGLCSGQTMALDGPTGTHTVELVGPDNFSISLCVPNFLSESIPVSGLTSYDGRYHFKRANGEHLSFVGVSMGNPHAVIEVEDVDEARVTEIGLELQKSPHLTPRINVGFVQILSRTRIKLRVFEFGAGETLACGSGACAAVAAMIRTGKLENNVQVELPGGELKVSWPAFNQAAVLSGPAKIVFEGNIENDHL